MGIDPGTIEGLAVAFYERLGFDPGVPVDTFRLARTLLGPDAVERRVHLAGVPGRLFYVHGERRIAVSGRLPLGYQRHVAGHELGHIVLEEIGYVGGDLEQACDLFGAAVMAPMPAVRAMVRAFGPDHEAIADEVVSTQTWAALRVAECLGIPRAVVTPSRTYVRGPDHFEWGSDRELRQLARTRITRPGIRKTALIDDPKRVIIDVEDVG